MKYALNLSRQRSCALDVYNQDIIQGPAKEGVFVKHVRKDTQHVYMKIAKGQPEERKVVMSMGRV